MTCTALGRASGSDLADEVERGGQRLRARRPLGGADLAVVAGDLNAPGEVEVIREFHPVGLRDPGGGPAAAMTRTQ